ncbi:MAG: hypothetical protein KGL39_30575 [Patescibacteria group bacterium]|nr:hypothetical protein [Patescibacteria group bacterium]
MGKVIRMAYYLYDSRGYVGDVASIGGWRDAYTAVAKLRPVPMMETFFNNGVAAQPKQLAKALTVMVRRFQRVLRSDVRSTLDNLATLLSKCRGPAVLAE